jgi:hypothetical protein
VRRAPCLLCCDYHPDDDEPVLALDWLAREDQADLGDGRPAMFLRLVARAAPLRSQPSGQVEVRLSVRPEDVLELSRTILHFGPANWADPQSVMVGALDDAHAEQEGRRRAAVLLAVRGDDAVYAALRLRRVEVQVRDDDEAGVALAWAAPSSRVGRRRCCSLLSPRPC